MRRTASPESFHPWLDNPCPEVSTYSSRWSPSASPCSTSQVSAPSNAGSRSSTSASAMPHRHASDRVSTHSGVASMVP